MAYPDNYISAVRILGGALRDVQKAVDRAESMELSEEVDEIVEQAYDEVSRLGVNT